MLQSAHSAPTGQTMDIAFNFLTVHDIAELLKINPLTVYSYIQKGQLNAIKLGRHYRIQEKDFDRFLKDHKVSKKG